MRWPDLFQTRNAVAPRVRRREFFAHRWFSHVTFAAVEDRVALRNQVVRGTRCESCGRLSRYRDSAHRLATVTIAAWAAEVIAKIAQKKCATAASTLSILLHLLKTATSHVLQDLLLFGSSFHHLCRRFLL
jgi:hypothetical protein